MALIGQPTMTVLLNSERRGEYPVQQLKEYKITSYLRSAARIQVIGWAVGHLGQHQVEEHEEIRVFFNEIFQSLDIRMKRCGRVDVTQHVDDPVVEHNLVGGQPFSDTVRGRRHVIKVEGFNLPGDDICVGYG